jgi:hypothetical protein
MKYWENDLENCIVGASKAAWFASIAIGWQRYPLAQGISGDEGGLHMKYWEIIANNLSKPGWSWGCVATINPKGQTIFAADAHRDDGRRFIVQSDDKLSAFVELERQVLTVTFYLASIDAECAGGLS